MQEFKCTFCGSTVEEDESAIPKKDSRLMLAKFNEQMEKVSAYWEKINRNQCGSMTFWCGSGLIRSADTAIFVTDLQDDNKKKIRSKKSQSSWNQGFSIFCLYRRIQIRIRIHTSD
jgi:hypothetical protein